MSALEGVLSGGVARVVLKNALAAIPDDLDFRRRVLEVLESVAFPGVESIAEDVYADIEVGLLAMALSTPCLFPSVLHVKHERLLARVQLRHCRPEELQNAVGAVQSG